MRFTKYIAQKGRRGFTFIEMMVVVVVLSVALPAIFTIALIIFRQQLKVFALQTVKREGDTVFNTIMVNLKNNAVSVHNGYIATDSNEVCTTSSYNGSPIIFKDAYSNSFYFPLNGDTVSSVSSIPKATVNLSDSTVSLKNFLMTCSRPSSAAAPIITVSYDVVYKTSSTRTEDTAKLHYATKIRLRNN
jgi:prepilin-type N-terminal cleavage/methylation domain-containing protein